MSRSTIGAVVGATIGFIVTGGNPAGAQWGWLIGSGVGALTDNTTVYGPRLGDASQQTSQDGSPRTYGEGTYPTSGVILWRDERKEHKHKKGKGGPKQVTFTYTWSYAIGVGLEINNYLIIRRAGTIVYDTRPDSELAEIGYTSEQIAKTRMAQQKWLKHAKLYFGDDDQLPDPTIQAVKGVNNTPAYPGYSYIVLTDEPVTDGGGAIPIYDFVVAQCGTQTESQEFPAYLIITGQAVTEGDDVCAQALASDTLDFTPIPLATGATISSANAAYRDGVWGIFGNAEAKISIDNRQSWTPITFPNTSADNIAPGPDGMWLIQGSPAVYGTYARSAIANGIAAGFTNPAFAAYYAPTATTFANAEECYFAKYAGGSWWLDVASQGNLIRTNDITLPLDTQTVVYARGGETAAITAFKDLVVFEGYVYVTCLFDFGTPSFQLRRCVDTGGLLTFDELLLTSSDLGNYPFHLEVGNGRVLCTTRDGSKCYSSMDGFTSAASTGIAFDVIGTPQGYQTPRKSVFANGRFYYISSGNSGAPSLGNKCISTVDGISFVTHGGLPITELVSIAASDGQPPEGNYEIPDAPGTYVGPDGTIVSPPGIQTQRCTPTLGGIIRRQAAKREVTRVITDTLETTYVDGFRVATQTNPRANIQALQSAYMVDASEHDGQLRFFARPQPLTFTITVDDLTERDGDAIEWEVTKENDLLRKVTVGYFDPLTNYIATTQDWEARTSTIQALGEGVFELPLTGTKDWAKRGAEKSGKIAWAERMEAKLPLTIKHAARFTGEWGTLIDEDGISHTVRIARIEDEGLRRLITVRKTSASAYTSSAIGVRSPLPTFPTGNVRGPSVSVVMNMPVLVDSNDKAGVTWACTGLLSTWKGSNLELSRNTGSSWEQGPTIEDSCTMGLLTADLPSASRYARDDVNTLVVKLYPYCRNTLANVTDEDILREANAAALVYPSGKTEVIQFTTATLVAPLTYELTGLMRGLMDTTPGLHLEGATFVLLDETVKFVAIRPDDVGKTLDFRATSFDTDPDAALVQTITFDTIESLREWQPYNVVVTPNDSGGFCVAWIGRGRLGSSRAPTHSQWFENYEVIFTVGTKTYSVRTPDQSLCVTGETMLAQFGEGYGVPVVAVRARSRIATNDDDFDSIPGTPGTPSGGSETFVVTGTFPDAVEGMPYPLHNGDAGVIITGGYWDAIAYGEIVPGVGVFAKAPMSTGFRATGYATTAGASVTDLVFGSSSPIAGHTGDATVAQVITTLARPTYSPLDLRARPAQGDRLVATTVPWTTFDLDGGNPSYYSYGFDSGEHYGEFELTNVASPFRVGVNVTKGLLTEVGNAISVSYLLPNTASVEVASDGIYWVKYDAGTGAWEVGKVGTGLLDSGTLALPGGNLARLVCSTDYLQTARVFGNFGREAFAGSTGTATGVPFPAEDLPVQWAKPSPIEGKMRSGNGFTGASYGLRGGGPHMMFGDVGKSSGKHRVALGSTSGGRVGIAVASFDFADGQLGAAGTADSIGWDGTRIHACLAGAYTSAVVAITGLAIFALDATGNQLAIYRTNGDGSLTAVHTLALPSGQTWFPVEDSCNLDAPLVFNPAGPAGFDNWTH